MSSPQKEALDPFVLELLEKRGIVGEQAIEDFLNPNYEEHLHDPFLLKDMDKAVKRILKAIKKGEKIVAYTDYDTDGIPAGVILHDFFKKIEYEHFENYIPHRNKEGYGLNNEAIKQFAKDKVKVLITADCAITDNEEVALAQKLGIDVIVTDHHLPTDVLPPAYAVINPKRHDDTYPFDMLCGCGVAFKLIIALIEKGKEKGMFEIKEGWEKWLLDMVGIATVSDMVPLVGENRALAYYGLKVLRKSPRPGLVALLRRVRVPQHTLSEDDIGFVIGPRINAASRMDVPRRAFELLSTSDEGEAAELAKHLDSINNKRKTLVARIVKEAHKMIEGREIREVIVVGNPDWAPGILGLVANSLAEHYGRSTFVWGRGEEGEVIKGSCRSDGSISLIECMGNAQDTFLEFGGHHASGGFSLENEQVHTLEDALVVAYGKTEKNKDAAKEISIDGALSIDKVNWDTLRLIDKLAPFGVGNPRPVFLFEEEISDIRWFGKEKNHIELTFKDSKGGRISAIAFFIGGKDEYTQLSPGMRLTFKAPMEANFFMGRRSLRLRILEIVRCV